MRAAYDTRPRAKSDGKTQKTSPLITDLLKSSLREINLKKDSLRHRLISAQTVWDGSTTVRFRHTECPRARPSGGTGRRRCREVPSPGSPTSARHSRPRLAGVGVGLPRVIRCRSSGPHPGLPLRDRAARPPQKTAQPGGSRPGALPERTLGTEQPHGLPAMRAPQHCRPAHDPGQVQPAALDGSSLRPWTGPPRGPGRVRPAALDGSAHSHGQPAVEEGARDQGPVSFA